MRLVDSLRGPVDPDDPACRDPEFIRTYALPFFRFVGERYFRAERMVGGRRAS